jgi:hypothetical protein
LVVPALVLLGGLSMEVAVGTSLVVITLKSFAGFLGYLGSTNVQWDVAGYVTAAAVVGSFLGGRLAGRFAPDVLRQGFAWFVVAMAIFILGQQVPELLGAPVGVALPYALVAGLLVLAGGLGWTARAQARAKPGHLAVASYGNGTPSHLAIELLKISAGVDLIHVPYNGSAPAMIDVRGGRVPLLMDIVPSHIKTMEDGEIVGLGVGQKTRSTLVPNVPTFEEGGLTGLDLSTWVGLAAPAGTPPEVIQRLNQAAQRALADPDLMKSFAARGMAVTHSTPEEFDRRIRAEIAQSAAVIKRAGIKLE